jgi:hypothetical protein
MAHICTNTEREVSIAGAFSHPVTPPPPPPPLISSLRHRLPKIPLVAPPYPTYDFLSYLPSFPYLDPLDLVNDDFNSAMWRGHAKKGLCRLRSSRQPEDNDRDIHTSSCLATSLRFICIPICTQVRACLITPSYNDFFSFYRGIKVFELPNYILRGCDLFSE